MSTDLTPEQEEARKPSISPALRREMNNLALGRGFACAVLRQGTKRTGSGQKIVFVKLGRGSTGKAPRRAVWIPPARCAAVRVETVPREVAKLLRAEKKQRLARKARELRERLSGKLEEVAS